MKRYNVTIERTYIVYANDEDDARHRTVGLLGTKDIKQKHVVELPPLASEAHGPEIDRWSR